MCLAHSQKALLLVTSIFLKPSKLEFLLLTDKNSCLMLLHYIPSPTYMVHVINVQKCLAYIAVSLSIHYLHVSLFLYDLKT